MISIKYSENRVAKVYSILQNSDFYYKLALDQLQEEDFTSALKNLWDAVRLERKEKYLIEIAETYYKTKSYEASLTIYMELLAKNPAMDYLMAIARNLADSGYESLAAPFAVNTLMSMGKRMSSRHIQRLEDISENDKILRMFSAEEVEPGPKLIDRKARRDKEKLTEAYFKLNKGDFDGAIQVLNDYDIAAENYDDALDIMCGSAISNGDTELAVKTARKILAVNPFSITAYQALVLFNQPLHEDDVYDEEKLCGSFIMVLTKNRLDEKLRTFSVFLFLYKKYECSLKAVYAACDINPANCDNLVQAINMSFALGKKAKGEYYLHKLAALYPEDINTKTILWIHEKKYGRAVWKNYFLDYPYDKMKDLVTDFVNEYHFESKNIHIITPRAADYLRVIVDSDDLDSIEKIVRDILSHPKQGIKEELYKYLIDIRVSPEAKEIILRELLHAGVDAEIAVLAVNKMMYCRLASVKDVLPPFSDAYTEVFVNILLNGGTVVHHLLQSVAKEMSKINVPELNKKKPLAAAMNYYYALLDQPPIEIKELAKTYNTTQVLLKKYISAYKINI